MINRILKFFNSTNIVVKVVIIACSYVLLLMSVLFILSGCGSSTVIKDETLKVPVPEVNQTLGAEAMNTTADTKAAIDSFFNALPDSVYFEGQSSVTDSTGHTIQTDVKFYPSKKDPVTNKPQPYFQIVSKQSDIHLQHRDTTRVQAAAKETIWDKFGSAVAIAVFIVIIIWGIKLIRNKK